MVNKFGFIGIAAVSVVAVVARALSITNVPIETIPIWVNIIGMIGMPFVSLVGIIFTIFHVGARVRHSEANITSKVTNMEHTFNGKMDQLLKLTRDAALAEGEMRGRRNQVSELHDAEDQELHDRRMRETGAAELLKAQQTPPAVSGPPKT